MENLICVSTGCVYKISEDRNELIKIVRQFNPQGIELSFAYPQYLFNFKITPENLNYLKSLEYVSIHSPSEIKYGNNPESREVLQMIENLYQQIGAKNVVFHNECIDDIMEITSYSFTASIENDDFKKQAGLNTPEKVATILNKNPKLKFTFDFAHALSVNLQDIPTYIEKFKDKLIQTHVSFLDRQLTDHWFLHKYDRPEIRQLLKQLEKTNAPLVLECAASDASEINLIGNEINYLRSV